MEKQVVVDLNDIIDAMDATNGSFVNKETGEVIFAMQDGDFGFESEDESLEVDLIELPDEWDIEKYKIMERFCFGVSDLQMKETLLHAIQGKGAFGRFKTAIHCYKIEEDWYQFLHARLKEIAIEFCNEHNLKYRYLQR